MKNDYSIRAYRTETKYDLRDNLISLLDVQVPADALEFLRSAHNAQDNKDVTFTVMVTNQLDGDLRRLRFTSKGSKMKDFVPVATLEKFANPHDDLNSLFDSAVFELILQVEVKEKQEGPSLFDQEEEEPEEDAAPDVRVAGVLNAPKEVHALPAPETSDIQDVDFKVDGEEGHDPAAD